MTMLKVYGCNICRENMDKARLVGLNFSDMKKFKFDRPESTNGVHICHDCMERLQSPQYGEYRRSLGGGEA